MFFRPRRGQRGPHISLIRESEQPIRLDEARLAAWALSIGQRREVERPPFRPHRGELPDVDLSRAVPVARTTGPISRLLGWFAGRRADAGEGAEAPGETAMDAVALGETGRKPYAWLVEAESTASSADAEPQAAAVEYNGSRAA